MQFNDLLVGFGLIAAIAEHRVNGVKALPGTALRTVALEWNTEGKDFPGCDQPTRLGNFLWGDIVQRPDLVLWTPFPQLRTCNASFRKVSSLLISRGLPACMVVGNLTRLPV